MKQLFLTAIIIFFLAIYINAQNSSPYWSLAGNSNATSSAKLGTTNNISLRFFTNNKQRMIINSAAGLVGIGATSPTDQLQVNSPSGTNAFSAQVNGSTKFIVSSNGNVGIGTSTPSYKLHVVNTSGAGIYISGATYGLRAYATNTFGSIGVDASGVEYGVRAATGSNGTAVYGASDYIGITGSGNTYGVGVYGYSYSGTGVRAVGGTYGIDASGSIGVNAYSENGTGGSFESNNYYGLTATSDNGAYAGVFYGNVYTSGIYQASDENLKQNIEELGNAMKIINKLKPKNYEFKKGSDQTMLHLPKGTHYGLLAQDLETVLPNLVQESAHELNPSNHQKSIPKSADEKIPVTKAEPKETVNIKAVNYTELIPIVIKGMQELSKVNEDLKRQNEDFRNQLNELKTLVQKFTETKGNNIKTSFGYLKQNAPNPSNNSTVISYFTPNDTKKAQILITDMKGSILRVYDIAGGEGQLSVKSGELAAGTYNYTLYVNLNKVSTKQMVVKK